MAGDKINLDLGFLQEKLPVFQNSINGSFVEAMEDLGAAIAALDDSNPIVDAIKDAGRALEAEYNDSYLPPAQVFSNNVDASIDLTEYLQSQQLISGVKANGASGYDVRSMDASKAKRKPLI